MLFQSWEFLLFFLIFMTLWLSLRATRLRLWLLLAASYIFYAFFDLRFVPFLILITLSDYGWGWGIASARSRIAKRLFLTGSILINLGILGSFKYMKFLTENLAVLLEYCSVQWTAPEIDWLLPVGLSFFTFKSLTYTFDLYYGRIKAERNLLRYASYAAFFPQLAAGPIDRASDLLPQLRHKMPLGKEDLAAGVSIFVCGLFKKTVIADLLALYVDQAYSDPSSQSGAFLLFASYAFAWQIYFDFSAYSDMARGVARMMGYRTILNFDNPYTAVDVRDFWRRWHISLSTWFRDYLYIPLGGNRCIRIRVWWNILFTMLVSGLWHGAAWTFIIWGGLNGIGSVISPAFDRRPWYVKIPAFVKQLLVFHFITLTWIFFRASTLEDAWSVVKGIARWEEGDFVFPLIPALLVGALWLYELIWAGRFRFLLESRAARIGAFVLMLIFCLLFGTGANTQFIYQQF